MSIGKLRQFQKRNCDQVVSKVMARTNNYILAITIKLARPSSSERLRSRPDQLAWPSAVKVKNQFEFKATYYLSSHRFTRVGHLCLLKSSSSVTLFGAPQGVDNTQPIVAQGPHCHTVTFTFGPLPW